MGEDGAERGLSRQGGRIAGRYRAQQLQLDGLVGDVERSRPEAARRRDVIRGATRSGRSAVKARAVADLRLIEALNHLLGAGLSIRTAADRIGLGYGQARQLLRPPSDG